MVVSKWEGKWIGYQYDPREDLGFFAFRKSFSLDQVPAELIAKVSADNRYKLYINGEMTAFGPQRGDERHWFYETLDLAPYLLEGENTIVALVWNFGWLAPMAQHTVRTAFLFDCPSVEGLSTPGGWKVRRIEGWDFEMMHSKVGDFYIDIGPGEIISPPGASFLDAVEGYRPPNVISHAEERGDSTGGTPWMLIPRSIPPMRYEVRDRGPVVRRHDSVPVGRELNKNQAVATGSGLILDYGELLCAYPRFTLSGPEGSCVTVTYAEAPSGHGGEKGNRDDIEGKKICGYQDKLVLGPQPVTYEPAWWRTYRYLLIEPLSSTPQPPSSVSAARFVPPAASARETEEGGPDVSTETEEWGTDAARQTAMGGILLHSVEAVETGYPLLAESSFVADDPWVEKIWDVSLRTAERCAGETYFDCPYYEQLQYVGDTRIQALIGYYLGRDRSLQRNAVETLGWSIMENGLTQSRYPSRQTQVIPPFSLWWVMMLYDQMLYDSNTSWAKWRGAGVTATNIFSWNAYAEADAFWQFADWVPTWRAGIPPKGARAEVHRLALAVAGLATVYLKQGTVYTSDRETEELRAKFYKDVPPEAVRSYLDRFDKIEGLVHSTRETVQPASEHAESLWRVIQIMADDLPDPWPSEDLELSNAVKCTYYFSYYKHLAMFGRPDNPFNYMQELEPWKEQIEMGLTTFAENPEPTRSDCHAWSAHPILGFFQIVAGVTSIAPGWSKARIMPQPGSLKRFDAHIAHPKGDLNVKFENGRLELDSPIPFTLIWQGKTEELDPGRQTLGI